MTTTQTLTPAQFGTLAPGDRITAVNDSPVLYTVSSALSPVGIGSAQAVGLSRPDIPGVVNLYPDNFDESETITVIRAARTDAQGPRMTIAGRTLTRSGTDWVTLDDRYRVRREVVGYTECQGGHPARLTPALIEWAGHTREVGAAEILAAHTAGRKGYVCPGGAPHAVQAWTLWDRERGEMVVADGRHMTDVVLCIP